MKQGVYIIKKNAPLTTDVYELVLAGDTSACKAPGQFIDVKLPERFLRRPISVCDWDGESITVLYKLLGGGTELLSALPVGTALDVLTGLGNGYDLSVSGDRPLLVGGGVGIPPLYRLAKELISRGRRPAVLLGFNRKEDMFYVNRFEGLGAKVTVTTADGSFGIPGFVTDGLSAVGTYTYAYACGPTAMLRALDGAVTTSAQYSFEERMGCGFGACVGCTCRTKNGYKRVCKDGPVFRREEVLW